jgi:hypothetical protein
MSNPLIYEGYASDPPGTKLFEDAMCYHSKSPWGKAVSICATAITTNNVEKEELLTRALNDTRPLFSQKELDGHTLSRSEIRKAICVTIEIKECTARQIAIGDITLREHLSYGWVNHARQHPDLLISKFLNLAEDYRKIGTLLRHPEEEVVSSLLLIFNRVCATYLSDARIPFITTKGNYDLGVGYGKFGVFNKPLRDNYSFLNNAQIAHYIQHGKQLFTGEDLRKILRYHYLII